MKTRDRIVNSWQFQNSKWSNVIRVYYIKNTRYGAYCDSIEFNKVQVTFKNTRENFDKSRENKKTARSLWRSRERIYHLVEANVSDEHKPVFFTLTQSDQEKDLKTSNKKIKAVMRRLKAYLGYKPLYIIVPERHKTGAIHYHGVFFNLPYVDVRTFRYEIWREGYVDLQLPRKIKSVARYLAKYLTKDTLDNLPINEKSYFCSRGLVIPTCEYTVDPPCGIVKTLEITRLKAGLKIKYLCQMKQCEQKRFSLATKMEKKTENHTTSLPSPMDLEQLPLF